MSNPQHEPTMEEILASIRKIISEDATEEQPAPQPEAVAEAAPEPEAMLEAEPEALAPADLEVDDVLELTDEVAEEPMPAPEPEPVDEVIFAPADEPVAPEPEPEPMIAAGDADADIFTDKTRKALDDAFASIEPEEDPAPALTAPAPMPSMDGASVEAVFDRAVREAFDPVLRAWLGGNSDAIMDRMKPVIREWMDEHFPPMLEEAVRNEVARVAKARRR